MNDSGVPLEFNGWLHLEDITPESWLTREIYANFGLALYMAQALEQGIVNLALYTGVRDGNVGTFDAAEADDTALFRRTMGQLKNRLMDRRPDVAEFEGMLGRAVRLRNFLAHQYFRQRSAAFGTEDGQTRMIEELTKARDFFEEVDARLDPLTMEILDSMGLLEHMQQAEEELRQAGFGDPLPGLA